jgi:hypothetical protein
MLYVVASAVPTSGRGQPAYPASRTSYGPPALNSQSYDSVRLAL